MASPVALILIDLQQCFINGSLAVNGAAAIIPKINQLQSFRLPSSQSPFDLIVRTYDWHPADHVSFAVNHPRGHPELPLHRPISSTLLDRSDKIETATEFTSITLQYTKDGSLCNYQGVYEKGIDCSHNSRKHDYHRIQQRLWPQHCVADSADSQLHPSLSTYPQTDTSPPIHNIYKGKESHIDSYSAFYDVGRFSSTTLSKDLRDRNIKTVVLAGLTLDYCVYYTALDALAEGFTVFVVTDLSLAVTPQGAKMAIKDMKNKGIHLVMLQEFIRTTERLLHFS